MAGYVVTFAVGVVCIVFGVSHCKGDLSMLHSYHYHRVSEKDRLPFGRRVGIGTVLEGASIALYSILSTVALYTEMDILFTIGTVVLIVGLVVGLTITVAAMIKYNKGIF